MANAKIETIDLEKRNPKQIEILELFGTIEYDPEYDYKVQSAFQRPKACHSRAGGNQQVIEVSGFPPCAGMTPLESPYDLNDFGE
jgi:hypothetical protein